MSVTIVPCLSPLSLAGTSKKENTILFYIFVPHAPKGHWRQSRDNGDTAHYGGDGISAIGGRAARRECRVQNFER